MSGLLLIAALSLATVQVKGTSGEDVTIFNSFNYKTSGEDEDTIFNGEFRIEEQKEDIDPFNTTLDSAKKINFPEAQNDWKHPMTKITGSVGTGRIPDDYYYFVIPDRAYFKCCYDPTKLPLEISILDENHNHMFDVKDYFDEEDPSSNAFMKRGAYYLKIHNPNNVSVTYGIYLGIRLDTELMAENMRTLVLNDEFLTKHQAVVWQSDYLPKDSQPIDGSLLEENHTNGLLTSFKLPRIVSCGRDYKEVYRVVYLWGKDSLNALLKDIDNLLVTLDKIKKENARITNLTTSLSMISSGLSMVSFFCSNKLLDTVSLGLGLVSNIIGNNIDWDYSDLYYHLGMIQGAIGNSDENDGLVLKLVQEASLEKKKTGSKKHFITKYRLKIEEKVRSDNGELLKDDTIIARKSKHHEEIRIVANKVSDSGTSGCFKIYDNVNDVDHLIWENY